MTKFVFGAGIALINNWKLIKKNFNPIGCVDNDCTKWGKTLSIGLKCMNIDEMLTYENPEVLITVGDPYVIRSIMKQLEQYSVRFVILTDLLSEWGRKEKLPEHLKNIKKEKKRKIILMNTPEHDNVGDHLIAISELDFLRQRFVDYSIYEVTDIEYLWFRQILKKYITPEDVILITGGGFLGSLWLYNGEINVRNIILDYSNNRIVILPQTIFFENNERGEKELAESLCIYNKAKNLTLLVREKKSYDFLKKIDNLSFRYDIMPDMALFYRGLNIIKSSNIKNEKVVLFCMRKDKESVTEKYLIESIEKIFVDDKYIINNTSMHSELFEGLETRGEQVVNKLREVAHANVFVTDTLHGMISAALTGTTCFVYDNLSKKISNVYDWISNLSYVHFCADLNEIKRIITEDSLGQGEFFLDSSDKYLYKLERIIRDE